MKKEALNSSEKAGNIYQLTRSHIGDPSLQHSTSENVKYRTFTDFIIIFKLSSYLTLTLLKRTIWRAPINASKWRMGFNSVFKGLTVIKFMLAYIILYFIILYY